MILKKKKAGLEIKHINSFFQNVLGYKVRAVGRGLINVTFR